MSLLCGGLSEPLNVCLYCLEPILKGQPSVAATSWGTAVRVRLHNPICVNKRAANEAYLRNMERAH